MFGERAGMGNITNVNEGYPRRFHPTRLGQAFKKAIALIRRTSYSPPEAFEINPQTKLAFCS
jgi:hypothetical protein